MSLVRLIFGILLVAFSAVALADNQAAATNGSASASAGSAATSSATKSTVKAAHHKAAPVDLNSADAATLAKVRGIGAKKAQAIVDYRTKNGPFTSADDLKNVTDAKGKPLFTAKGLAAVEKHVTVSSPSSSSAQQ